MNFLCGTPVAIDDGVQANNARKAKDFDEAEHPRVPAGSQNGGEFTSGDGGSESSSSAQSPEPMATYSALRDYQNYAHNKINKDLREGKTSPEHEAYVAALDRAFDDVKAAKTTVYRGDGAGLGVALAEAKPLPKGFKVSLQNIAFPSEAAKVNAELTAHFGGMVVEDKAYLSTSKSQDIAMDKFVPGSHDITEWTGSGLVEVSGRMKALDIDKITKMDAKEKERLLPRGAKLRVDSVSVQPHPDGKRVYLHWKVSVAS